MPAQIRRETSRDRRDRIRQNRLRRIGIFDVNRVLTDPYLTVNDRTAELARRRIPYRVFGETVSTEIQPTVPQSDPAPPSPQPPPPPAQSATSSEYSDLTDDDLQYRIEHASNSFQLLQLGQERERRSLEYIRTCSDISLAELIITPLCDRRYRTTNEEIYLEMDRRNPPYPLLSDIQSGLLLGCSSAVLLQQISAGLGYAGLTFIAISAEAERRANRAQLPMHRFRDAQRRGQQAQHERDEHRVSSRQIRIIANDPWEMVTLGLSTDEDHRQPVEVAYRMPAPVKAEGKTLFYGCMRCSSIFPLSDLNDIFPIITKHSPSYREANPYLVCKQCRSDLVAICPTCTNEFWSSGAKNVVLKIDRNGRKVKGARVCPECYSAKFQRCRCCSNSYEKETTTEVRNGFACRFCLQNYYVQCVRCDTHEHQDFSRDGLCANCYELRHGQVIHGHAFKPKLDLYGKGPHFYGVELEVECPDTSDPSRIATQVNEIFEDFVIIKRDGSLSYGFEIVTCPATLETHRERWPAFFAKMPKGLKSFRTLTCGLHVHCSRAPLSHLTIGKMLAFINHPSNRAFIELIAQRPSTNYSKFKDKGIIDARLNDPDRYQALNLCNTDTVEFRLFKGTLRPQSFFKSIEFCDALIHFCLPGVRSYRTAHRLSDFLPFVDMHRKEWPNLQAFIQARWRKKASRHTKLLKINITPAPHSEQ